MRTARREAIARAEELGRDDLAGDVAIVVTELVTNAVLHGSGCEQVNVEPSTAGLRISVEDRSEALPMLGHLSADGMTGRGLHLVGQLVSDWGVERSDGSKVIWAEVTGSTATNDDDLDTLLDRWGEPAGSDQARHAVVLGEVSTALLLAAKAHVDNLVREFELLAASEADGSTPPVSQHLSSLLSVITDRFSDARLSIKELALRAAHAGRPRTDLTLHLTADAADAGHDYLQALDELDDYCRAARLFTLESEPEHRVFRRWYVEQIVAQVRAAVAGRPAPPLRTFEERLLAELRVAEQSRRAADRTSRLYRLARALAVSATPEAVADAVLVEGVAALRADAGGLLLAQDQDSRLALPGAVGYDEAALARLRNEPRSAELPAAKAFRTGAPVWLESREERDRRFPELVGLEPATEALCAVPLLVGDRCLGALRFSFKRPLLFDDEEQNFVLALADQTAQALDRAQLQHERITISQRLQRGLLPPELPTIPGVELSAIYHPFGTGVDAGGDFYDAWPLAGNRWAIAIGDASGTGPEAAALTARVRHSLRALSLTERRPDRVLRRLNTLLSTTRGDDEQFCTAIFGIVSRDEVITVDLVGGGHPEPMLHVPGEDPRVVPLTGSLLGVLDEPIVDRVQLELVPGATLVLYTDGVIEARSPDGRFYEDTGFASMCDGPAVSAGEIAESIEQSVLDHCGALQDDMAIVVLRALG